MEDYNWEYVDDNSVDYLDSMTESAYYADEKNEWEKYYYEIHEEIEY